MKGKVMKGLENMSYGEHKLRDLGLFSLEHREVRGSFIALYNYMKRSSSEVKASGLFYCAYSERTRGKDLKTRHWRFRLNI